VKLVWFDSIWEMQSVRPPVQAWRRYKATPVAHDDRTLHGAACHGCLLVAETSCEARNLFLDRALMVNTVGQTGASFFG
jgi:hypothetical protein